MNIPVIPFPSSATAALDLQRCCSELGLGHLVDGNGVAAASSTGTETKAEADKHVDRVTDIAEQTPIQQAIAAVEDILEQTGVDGIEDEEDGGSNCGECESDVDLENNKAAKADGNEGSTLADMKSPPEIDGPRLSRPFGNSVICSMYPAPGHVPTFYQVPRRLCPLYACVRQLSTLRPSPRPIVTLENVEVFKLDISFGCLDRSGVIENTDHALRTLIDSIHLPMLSHMDLQATFFTTPMREVDRLLVFSLLPNPATHSNLASLRLTSTFDDEEWSYLESNLDKPKRYFELENFDPSLVFHIQKAPFLTSLTVHANFELRISTARVSESWQSWLPLHRLELECCSRITSEFLEDLHFQLARDGNREGFEDAVVRDCPRISASVTEINRDLAEKMRFVKSSESWRWGPRISWWDMTMAFKDLEYEI